MSGNKCKYLNCGQNRRKNKDVRMFRFPKDENLVKQWIINCGNASLADLPPDLIKNRYLCEKHFLDDDFRTGKRHFLKKDAVPLKYSESSGSTGSPTVLIPQKTYSDKKRPLCPPDTPERKKICLENENSKTGVHFLSAISDLPDIATSRNQKMKSHIRYQASNIKKLRYTTKLTRNDNVLNILPFLTHLTPAAKTFVLMQVRGKRSNFTKSEKEFSIAFFHKSPCAYVFLRRKGIILPAPTTVRRWIRQNTFKTGFDENIKKHLQMKCEVMTSKEKKCVIAFGEMAIKESLEYNKKLDLIEGFEDLGTLGRSNKNATHVLVFCMRGLYSNWKVPVSYFFSANSVEKENLKDLILHAVRTLFDIGFIPKLIVCDQSSNNRGALNLLGATKDKPYFFSGDSKIIAIFDAPDLFKSIRNNMLSGIFKVFDKIISFYVIKKTYEIDKNSKTARTLPKITDKHINPNAFEGVSYKLALQIFSNTMATAIKTCVDLHKVDQKIGTDTADFVLTLNNIFDALNSKKLFSKNPFNCGLTDKNTCVIDVLNEGKHIFESLVKISNNSKKEIVQSRPHCFEGMVQTINGVFELFNQEKEQNFLLTSRLNRDFLGNFFSDIRQKGGCNVTPTARSFRLSFRIQTIIGLLKPSKISNCEPDRDFSMTSICDSRANDSELEQIDSEMGEVVSESFSSLVDNPSLEDCAINYYSGYLLYELKQKFHCTTCDKQLGTDEHLYDEHQLFLLHKNYGCDKKLFLKAPAKELEEVVYKSMLEFKKYFAIYRHHEHVMSKLKNHIMSLNVLWLGKKDNDFCYEHRDFLMSHMIKTNLYRFCYKKNFN